MQAPQQIMKLQILDAIHQGFSVLPIPHTDADEVVLMRDIHIKNRAMEWAKQFKKSVLYVLGNDEFHKEQFQKIRKQAQALTQTQPFKGKTVIFNHHAAPLQTVTPENKNEKLVASIASVLVHIMGESLWRFGSTGISIAVTIIKSMAPEWYRIQQVANPSGIRCLRIPCLTLSG